MDFRLENAREELLIAVTIRAPRAVAQPHVERYPLTVRLLYAVGPLAVLAVLAGVIVHQGRLAYPDSRFRWDQYTYIAMAQHPLSIAALEHVRPPIRVTPFCWRILTPLIVHFLPLPVLSGFWIVTLVALATTTVALGWFLRGVGLSPAAAAAGSIAFILLPPATGFTLWAYTYVDPLAFALLTCALGCIVHRRGVSFVLAIGLCALTKETAILGAAFGITWALQTHDRIMLRWATIGAVLCVGTLILLRQALPASYSLLDEFHAIYDHTSVWAGDQSILMRLIDAAGWSWCLMLPVAVFQFMHRPRIWLSPAFFVLLAIAEAQVLVSWAVDRTVVYAFPVVIAACAFEVEGLAARFTVSRWILWALIWASELVVVLTGALLPSFVAPVMRVPYSHSIAAQVYSILALVVVLRWLARRVLGRANARPR